MNVPDVLRNVLHIVLIVLHRLQTLRRLLQLENVLTELGICSIKVIIVDIISASLKLVSLCTEYHTHRRCLQLILPLHLHQQLIWFLLCLRELKQVVQYNHHRRQGKHTPETRDHTDYTSQVRGGPVVTIPDSRHGNYHIPCTVGNGVKVLPRDWHQWSLEYPNAISEGHQRHYQCECSEYNRWVILDGLDGK